MSAGPNENGPQGSANDPDPVDSEATPVGGASKQLLELSEGGDQNTRAYRAPRELLELARRQRAASGRHSQRAEPRHSAAPPVPIPGLRSEPPGHRPTSSPRGQPGASRGRSGPEESSEVASSQKRRVRPISVSPSEFSEGEAAPPRPIAEPLGLRDRPTRRPGRSSEESAESSAPSISYQPASSRSAQSVEALEQQLEQGSELVEDAAPPVARSRPSSALSSEPSSASPIRAPASLEELARLALQRTADAVPGPPPPANDLDAAVPSSASADLTSDRNRVYSWAFVFVLFILIGFVLARWHVLDLLLPPAR